LVIGPWLLMWALFVSCYLEHCQHENNDNRKMVSHQFVMYTAFQESGREHWGSWPPPH
jgi:hypothetical protein